MRSGDYHTMHGLWRYFTADDGQICLEKHSYLMIGTLEAYGKIRDYFGAESVKPLYVWVEDGERLARALERGTQPGASEIRGAVPPVPGRRGGFFPRRSCRKPV